MTTDPRDQGTPARLPAEAATADAAATAPSERPSLWSRFLGGRTAPAVPAGPVEILPTPRDVLPHERVVSLRTVVPRRALARILYDETTSNHHYELIEPTLTADETRILASVRDTLVRTLDGKKAVNASDPKDHLVEAATRVLDEHGLATDPEPRARVLHHLARDLAGYGRIDALLLDNTLEDISCDGVGVPVYVFHREHGSIRTNVVFHDEYELDTFVIRLAQRAGKQITIAEPLLDATLPNKSRLQASLSREVTTRGSSFTIRRFRADPLTPPELVRLGTMDGLMAAYFWMAMEEGCSIIFAGGTASGKTSTLNATSLFIPPQRKIVSIEDTRELNLPHENWVPGLTRSGFGGETGGGRAGEIDMYKLLETALRQRPEHLIVGEVRGEEARTLFQAMATGHAAYSTMHADSVASAVYRLENEPINVPRIMLQTIDVIAMQTQARVEGKLVRRIREVVEIVGIDPASGELLTNTVFSWDPHTDTHQFHGKSHVLDDIAHGGSWSGGPLEAELEARAMIVDWMDRAGLRRLDQVAATIAAYRHDRAGLLERARGERPAEAPDAR